MEIDDSVFAGRRAVRPLSVIVVGAGIGGLAVGLCMQMTGHNVVILEKRKQTTEVGAGIQLAPNATRILRRFGVLDEVLKHSIALERNSLRRWGNDEELGFVTLFPDVEEHFGAPLLSVHRADLLRILLDAAINCGCKILTDHEVVEVDQWSQPVSNIRINVRSHGKETWMSADLILAADGMSSVVRRQMATANGHADQLLSHGESAYRFILPLERIQHDELMMDLVGKNNGTRYIGPGGHIMAYPLRGNTLLNVVLVHQADGEGLEKTSWTAKGDKQVILGHYRGWCPTVQAMITYADGSGVLQTPMNTMPPLPTWVKGHIALAGDACHYMLPYVAQGASNAIEDAGVLATAFTCVDDIELALETYQLIRKNRGEFIQSSATNTGHTLHLPDGEEQRIRDKSIREASQGVGSNPDKWSDKQFREFVWRHDVMAETIEKLEPVKQGNGMNGHK
ncbi:putative salicylate hydroxylase [Nemania sp. FL0916]|nr:putative salicylate hydroxylase [Nemania sp. FL0916]